MEKEIDWIIVINFSPIWINKIYIKEAATKFLLHIL
jgi:hypothetical protein